MLIVMMYVPCVCLFAYELLFLTTIESNDVECTEKGGVFEYQEEEDQGQAIKASHLLVHI
jgi:hypothetical protein